MEPPHVRLMAHDGSHQCPFCNMPHEIRYEIFIRLHETSSLQNFRRVCLCLWRAFASDKQRIIPRVVINALPHDASMINAALITQGTVKKMAETGDPGFVAGMFSKYLFDIHRPYNFPPVFGLDDASQLVGRHICIMNTAESLAQDSLRDSRLHPPTRTEVRRFAMALYHREIYVNLFSTRKGALIATNSPVTCSYISDHQTRLFPPSCPWEQEMVSTVTLYLQKQAYCAIHEVLDKDPLWHPISTQIAMVPPQKYDALERSFTCLKQSHQKWFRQYHECVKNWDFVCYNQWLDMQLVLNVITDQPLNKLVETISCSVGTRKQMLEELFRASHGPPTLMHNWSWGKGCFNQDGELKYTKLSDVNENEYQDLTGTVFDSGDDRNSEEAWRSRRHDDEGVLWVDSHLPVAFCDRITGYVMLDRNRFASLGY